VGLVDLTDAETGKTVTLDARDPAAREAFAAAVEARREQTTDLLRRAGVDHVVVRTDADYIEPLITFFRRRAQRG
jgi:uncharacterized protein (DUF58 family)